MPACPGAMCEMSMGLIENGSKKALKESPKGLLWEEMQQEIDGSKPVEWR